MAKSSSPVRLQEDLMQAAAIAGEVYSRSAAEQVEYWASLGRSVANTVDPLLLLEVVSGLASLKIDRVAASPVSPESVFDSLEKDRSSGVLSDLISENPKYQASQSHPGMLEQLLPSGETRIGSFSGGAFVPMEG